MTTCSKCGAANRPGLAECRMCSSPLELPAGATSAGLDANSLHTTVVFPNLKTQKGTAGLTECLICPECQTINHLGWMFCPQCGKKVDSSFLQSMELDDQAPTMMSNALPGPRGAETVVAEVLITGSQPVADDRAQQVRAVEPPAPWKPEPQPPPREIQAPAPPSKYPIEVMNVPSVGANGAAQPESPHRPSLSGAAEEEMIYCAECGSSNDAEFFFCLSCGANLPVTKTVVMASTINPHRPRLRLLVQGQVSGPTYEIRGETRIGRTEGSITFPQDGLMSSSHARIVKQDSDYVLMDDQSSNGTFLKVKGQTKLEPGDVILVGKQLFRFEV